MNNPARVICESILGTYSKEVVLGKIKFQIKQPSIKDLCKVLGSSTADLNESMKRFEVIARMPEYVEESAKALSYIVSIKKPAVYRKLAYWYIKNFVSMEQAVNAFSVWTQVVTGKEIFESVKFASVKSDNKCQVVGANSLFGKMVSFMENLHLSYKDAFENISYPNLLIMSADKTRILSGSSEQMVEMTEDEYFKQRK